MKFNANELFFNPKSTKKIKFWIIGHLTIIDILFIFIGLGLGAALGGLLPINPILRVIIALFSTSICFFWIIRINSKPIWTYIINYFKYLSHEKIDYKYIKNRFLTAKTTKYTNIYQINDHYISVWELNNFNTELLSNYEREQFYNEYSSLIKIFDEKFKIVISNEPFELKKSLNYLNSLNKNNWIDKNIDYLKSLKSTRKNKKTFLIFHNHNIENIKRIENSLNFMKMKYFELSILNQEKVQFFLKNFIFSFDGELKEKTNRFINNKNKTNNFIHNLTELPTNIHFEWLKEFINIENLNFTINVFPYTKKQALKRLENADGKINANIKQHTTTATKSQEITHEKNGFEMIRNELLIDADKLYDFNIFLYGFNLTDAEYIKIKNILNNLYKTNQYQVDKLYTEQINALNSIMLTEPDKYAKRNGIEMLTTNFSYSHPFINNNIYDKKGWYIADATIKETPIFFNPFVLDKNRINHNINIFGRSGSGKSFLAKKIIRNAICENTKIFILDPEQEYNEIIQEFNGKYVNLNDINVKINPLQYFHNENINITAQSINEIKNEQLRYINDFLLLLFPELKKDLGSKTEIINAINETYIKFKTFTSLKNLNNLKPTSFPTFQDVIKIAVHKKYLLAKTYLSNFNNNGGIYSRYWNGHTTIKASDLNLIGFNLQELTQSQNKNICNITMFLLLKMINQEITSNKNKTEQKIMIAIDEAHLLANDENEHTLITLAQISKRIRKYHGSLMLISQQISDFTSTSKNSVNNEKHFRAITENTQYKFYGGLENRDIAELNKIYAHTQELTTAERNFLSKAHQGQFLFHLNSENKFIIKTIKLKNE